MSRSALNTVIHTLDARDNVMLEVMRDYYSAPADLMRRSIAGLLDRTTRGLRSKSIEYSELKPALVPHADRNEIALFFDTKSIEDGWYGGAVQHSVLPLLHKRSSRSVLVGDYIGDRQEILFNMFKEQVILTKDVIWIHNSQFYIVYINYLTKSMASNLLDGLANYLPFVGYADMTYSSRLKSYLSTILVNRYIQHRGVVIVPHEDDLDESLNQNTPGYSFENFGFTVRSVAGDLYGVLLSYKIERPVLPGFEVDTVFSLNAISSSPLSLGDLEVVVDESKFNYLKQEKATILRKIGMLDSNAASLKKTIRDKIASNYIYSMKYTAAHETSQFNIIIEMETKEGPFRVLAGLKYIPNEGKVLLITLF